MLKVQTTSFGELEINEQDVIKFKQGIPGFEHLHDFFIVRLDEEVPFAYMIALEEPNFSMIVSDPFIFYPEYNLKLSDELQEELRIEDKSDVFVWCTVTIKEDLQSATINLLAPLVINAKERLAKQIILNHSDYKTKHPLFRKIQSAGDGVK